MIKIVSWDAVGIRNEFFDCFHNSQADIFCVQDMQLEELQFMSFNPSGYYSYWNWQEKNKKSGTAIFTKLKPLSSAWGIDSKLDKEGRTLTLEYDKFYLVNVLTPESTKKYDAVRLEWDILFSRFVLKLMRRKSVIICGNLNVAHQMIDISDITYTGLGCTGPERIGISHLLELGITDTYRYCHPHQQQFTWHFHNLAMRIDYVLMSNDILKYLNDSTICDVRYGAVHSPVEVLLDIEAPMPAPAIEADPLPLLYWASRLPKPLDFVKEAENE